MLIEIDTHAHTLISGHAYNTIREMARMAADKGLKGLALTEHAPEMPGSTHLFYFQNLNVVPRQMEGIELLLGAELNIMNEDGEIDLPDNVIAELDISIASIHGPCYKGERTKEAVTRAYVNAMEKQVIDIIGHPDDGRFQVDYEVLVKTARRTETLLELNNSSLNPRGFRKNTRENMLEMLKCCKKYGVYIVLGTDAHVDVSIADYTYAKEVLEEADFPEELIANSSLEKLKALLKRNKKSGL